MRISEIQVERFGIWRNLALPLSANGLTVLYGPNEAGKTTLLRFIRGVLYGFGAELNDAPEPLPTALPMAGALRLEQNGERYQWQRAGFGGSRGTLSVTMPGVEASMLPGAEDMLLGVNENLYTRVFAVGLHELQELGTLSDEELTQCIYGLTLGAEGQRLLAAWHRAHAGRDLLLDRTGTQGELPELWREWDRLQARIEAAGQQRQAFGELATRRDRLEQEIAGFKQRQVDLQAQLRQALFAERAWGPWQAIRDSERELATVPVIQGFPDSGLSRLDRLEADLAGQAANKKTLIDESQQQRQQLQNLVIDPDLKKHAASMQGLVDQRGWLRELQTRVETAQQAEQDTQHEFETSRSSLGPDWTLKRLEAVDTTPGAHHRLAGMARSLQGTLARRRNLKQACQRLVAACQRQKGELAPRIQTLQGRSLSAAVADANHRLEELKKLAELRLHESEIEDRLRSIDEHRARVEPRLVLPKWVHVVLRVFAVMGVVLCGWGLWTGALHSGIAGAIYALLGITCGGLAWGLRTQFEGDAQARLAELDQETERNQAELRATRELIRRLTNADIASKDIADQEPVASTGSPAAIAAAVPPAAHSVTAVPVAAVYSSSGPVVMSNMPAQNPYSDPVVVDSVDSIDRDAGDIGAVTGHEDEAVTEPAAELATAGLQGELTAAPRRQHSWKFRLQRSLRRILIRARSWKRRSPQAATPVADENTVREVPTGTASTDGTIIEPAAVVSSGGDDAAADRHRPAPNELDLIREITQEIVDLEQLRQAQRDLQQLRRKLADGKNRLKTARREEQTARHNWRELQRQFGMPEADRVEDTFSHWRTLVAVIDRLRVWKQAQANLAMLQDLWNVFQQRIEHLGHRLQAWDADYTQPLAVLADWESRLADHSRRKRERRELRSRIAARRREVADCQSQWDELNVRRNALLVQGGAANREEFEQRARAVERRQLLETNLAEARQAWTDLRHSQPGQALDEELLRQFDREANSRSIEFLKAGSEELEHDLQQAFERLGSLKQELEQLVADDESTRLRYDREQLATRLRETTRRWFVAEQGVQIVDEMRRRYERMYQPAVLATASKFLARLTCGKYNNIWTPLGERHLQIDDEHQVSLAVEHLSRGTREQLFLAIRLAIVQDFASRGIMLPIVLDDIVVNFDQRRAEATLDVLLDLASQGHQVLFFTCHLHLAHQFEGKGAATVWLPGHNPPIHDLTEHRLAS